MVGEPEQDPWTVIAGERADLDGPVAGGDYRKLQHGVGGYRGHRGGSLSSSSRTSRIDGRCGSSSAGHKASSRRLQPRWSIASSRWMARARSWSSKTEEATAPGITAFTLSKPDWRHPQPGGDQPDYHHATSEACPTPARQRQPRGSHPQPGHRSSPTRSQSTNGFLGSRAYGTLLTTATVPRRAGRLLEYVKASGQ